ncbi:hypothetical protein K7432_015510 [Basidiobolus ranarum]|uniref:Uncharacterized protein n=1 Tax=Basidiobolus ranarum TaxID=34480 RepID=A0ABR2WG12_9FUNG
MPYNYCTPVALGLRDEVHDVDQELLLLHEVVQAPPALPDGTAVGESVTSLGGGHWDGVGILCDPVTDMSVLLGIEVPTTEHEATTELVSEEMEDSYTIIDELPMLVGCVADPIAPEESMLLLKLGTAVVVGSEAVFDDRAGVTI